MNHISNLTSLSRTNYVKISKGEIKGTISTMSLDYEVNGVEVLTEEEGRKFRLFSKNKFGHSIEVGSVWERRPRSSKKDYVLKIILERRTWKARLIPVANEIDLYRIDATDYLNSYI